MLAEHRKGKLLKACSKAINKRVLMGHGKERVLLDGVHIAFNVTVGLQAIIAP
jgi:hypothetical protein